MGGETHADAHIAEGVFENQIPADDPGDQLAEGGVGIGVSRAGDGNHRGQFGVTEAGEDADDGDQYERKRESRTRAGPSRQGSVVDEVMDQRGIADAGHVELLPSHGRADDGEDARADDGADAESGERPRPQSLLERILGLFRVADQLIDRLACAKLSEQGRSPRPAIGRDLSMHDSVFFEGYPAVQDVLAECASAEVRISLCRLPHLNSCWTRSGRGRPRGKNIAGARAEPSSIEHFRELCRPGFCRFPTHSAEKCGMDGARKSTVNPKML